MLITTRLFPTRPLGRWRAHKVLERDVLVYRRNWTIIVSGFFEPVFYLLGIGFGLGTLVGDVGDIPYAAFVAPGLMATAAMNGALFEATFNLFFKLKYAKTFDAILATPLGPSDIAVGEVSWSLTRGLLYAIGFLVVMLAAGPGPLAAGHPGHPGRPAHRLGRGLGGHGGHAPSCASGRTSTWSPW